jgi:hypothetical protein
MNASTLPGNGGAPQLVAIHLGDDLHQPAEVDP